MKANRFYRVVRAIVIPLLHMFFPYKITGKENVPAEGPVLLVSNHVSDFDPAFIVCGLNRKITYLGKKELFRFRILKWFFSNMGVIPVDRGGTDMHAMRASLSVLKEGGVLGIFPQGHRYKKDDNRDIENGASLLALKSRATIVPMYFKAPVKWFHRVQISIYPPIDISDIKKVDASAMQTIDDRMRRGIWGDKAYLYKAETPR